MTDSPVTNSPATENAICITLKLIAIYQETLGVPEKTLTLPAGTTVEEVLNQIIQENPTLTKWRELTRFGLNLQFVVADTTLSDGDELVLIPPVSGG